MYNTYVNARKRDQSVSTLVPLKLNSTSRWLNVSRGCQFPGYLVRVFEKLSVQKRTSQNTSRMINCVHSVNSGKFISRTTVLSMRCIKSDVYKPTRVRSTVDVAYAIDKKKQNIALTSRKTGKALCAIHSQALRTQKCVCRSETGLDKYSVKNNDKINNLFLGTTSSILFDVLRRRLFQVCQPLDNYST